MIPRPRIEFHLSLTYGFESEVFELLQDDCFDRHLGFKNETI